MNHRREGRWYGGEERKRKKEGGGKGIEYRVRKRGKKVKSSDFPQLPTPTEGKDETETCGWSGKGGNDSRVSTVRTERTEVIIVDRRGELRTGQDDGDGGK